MLKILIGKKIHRFWQRTNHSMILESCDKFIFIEIPYSKSCEPYIGGILEHDKVIELRNFLNSILEDE